MSNSKYDPILRNKIIRLHLEEGRTIKSLTNEYNLGIGTLRYWLDKHRKECKNNSQLQDETDLILEYKKFVLLQRPERRSSCIPEVHFIGCL